MYISEISIVHCWKKLKKFKYIYLEAFEYAFAFVFKDVALINCCDQYKVIYKIFFLTVCTVGLTVKGMRLSV